MDVSLVMFKADGTRREFPLTKPRVIVGRKNSCDLRIPLTSVSRQHCELLLDGDTLKVRDLGSSNGTYHNSNRVQEAELGPGDELVIGPVVFTVMIDGEPSTIEPVRTILTQAKDGSAAGLDASRSHETSDEPPEFLPEDRADDDDDDDLQDDGDPEVYELADDDVSSKPRSGESSEAGVLDLDDPLAALEALDKDEDDAGEFEFLRDEDEEK